MTAGALKGRQFAVNCGAKPRGRRATLSRARTKKKADKMVFLGEPSAGKLRWKREVLKGKTSGE